MVSLKNQAIQTALLGDLDTAIQLNKKILKADPQDIDTLNRLAFAHTLQGNAREAKKAYQKVLLVDKLNPIALRGLKRIMGTTLKNTPKETNGTAFSYSSSMFLEETGKTKIVELVNCAQPRTISRLRTGEPLIISMKRLKIFIQNTKDEYIGMLPDNIGKRLYRLLKGGNVYSAHVKSTDRLKVFVFLRETKRVSRFKNQPSFVSTEKSQLLFEKAAKGKAKKDEDYEDES